MADTGVTEGDKVGFGPQGKRRVLLKLSDVVGTERAAELEAEKLSEDEGKLKRRLHRAAARTA